MHYKIQVGCTYLVIWTCVILLRFSRHWQGTIFGSFYVSNSSHEFLECHAWPFLVLFSLFFTIIFYVIWVPESSLATFLLFFAWTYVPICTLLLSFYFTMLLSASLSLQLNRQVINALLLQIFKRSYKKYFLLRRNLQTF